MGTRKGLFEVGRRLLRGHPDLAGPWWSSGSMSQSRKLPLEGQLLGTAFNQDFGCFSAGVASGFRVFNCEPYKEQVGLQRGAGSVWERAGPGRRSEVGRRRQRQGGEGAARSCAPPPLCPPPSSSAARPPPTIHISGPPWQLSKPGIALHTMAAMLAAPIDPPAPSSPPPRPPARPPPARSFAASSAPAAAWPSSRCSSAATSWRWWAAAPTRATPPTKS